MLKRHSRIHTGIIYQRLSTYVNIVKYNMIKTGEKPYKCNVCQRSFTQVFNSIQFYIHFMSYSFEIL